MKRVYHCPECGKKGEVSVEDRDVLVLCVHGRVINQLNDGVTTVITASDAHIMVRRPV